MGEDQPIDGLERLTRKILYLDERPSPRVKARILDIVMSRPRAPFDNGRIKLLDERSLEVEMEGIDPNTPTSPEMDEDIIDAISREPQLGKI